MAFLADQRDVAVEAVLPDGMDDLDRGLAAADDDETFGHKVLYCAAFANDTQAGSDFTVMTRAIRIDEFGGPEVLQFREADIGAPGPGQVRIAHTAIGLNMIDTYYRKGLYPISLPSGLGSEAAGVVVATGEGVTGMEVGQRVAYASPAPLDGYAEERLIDARLLVVLPDGIGDETAAAMMLKGLTSWYLLTRSYRVETGEWIVLYAAAGGVGPHCLAMGERARRQGDRPWSAPRRSVRSRSNMAASTSLLADDDVVGEVRELTGGEGVAAVYDSVGRDTFYQSLDCLRRHGVMVSFGNASGRGRAVRADRARQARLALRDPADALGLRRRTRRSRTRRRGTLRCREFGARSA